MTPPEAEAVERVARAICHCDPDAPVRVAFNGVFDRTKRRHAMTESPEMPAWRLYEAKARAALAAMPEEWQPIETAPRDGTHIIAGGPGYAYEAFWEGADWWVMDMDGTKVELIAEPTHWRPLPAPPGALAAKGGGRMSSSGSARRRASHPYRLNREDLK